jgi:hypothetical protein
MGYGIYKFSLVSLSHQTQINQIFVALHEIVQNYASTCVDDINLKLAIKFGFSAQNKW